MLKREMATVIATALLPAHYRKDSPAVLSEIETQMKSSKPELEALMYMADRVHVQRQGEK
jgi:hypothetical protein